MTTKAPARNVLWHIQLFGGLRIRQQTAATQSEGKRVITRFRTQTTGTLLAYLAFYKGRSHPREVLIEQLWPDASLDSGRHNLSNALSSLRNQMEPPRLVTPGTVILADRLTVELNPAAFTSDVETFEHALRQAVQTRTGELQKAAALTRAIDAYGGILLPGYYEPWIAVEQQRLTRRFQDAALQLARLQERQGDITAALAAARRAAAFHQGAENEAASREVIRLLLADGDAAAALRQYRELEQQVRAETDSEPTPATRSLLSQIESAFGQSERENAITIVQELSPSQTPKSGLPPEGTITFLLMGVIAAEESTNAEGAIVTGASTNAPLISEQGQALLRAEIILHRGYIARDTHESFFVAFARASDAISCTIAIHASLEELILSEPVPELVLERRQSRPLPIRMSLHTGEAIVDNEGHYPRQIAAYASQIIAAAHDGQILCSATTAELIRREPALTSSDSAVILVDLGQYRLREVEAPDRLFLVQLPGSSQQEIPPLNAERTDTDGSGRNMPLQFTRFFGREEEIGRLKERILAPGAARLITLTGPGGTGKTRLAIEAAGQLAETLAGAVWFVPLADLTDPAHLIGAIEDALLLRRSGSSAGADPLDRIVASLSARPSLLILDNFEHLLGQRVVSDTDGNPEAAVLLVQALLERAASLTILVTSRQILGLPAEHEFPVAPLPTPGGSSDGSPEQLSLFDSVRLFVDRAQMVKPDFQITNHNAPTVAELCDRLEGIPLAIELAAARCAVMTPAKLLSLLGNRFELLVSRKRGIAERQRTLRATVDWSYHLLDPALQRFFAGLSVFRGGWTVEAAEDVLEEPLALDYLAQLRDCSMVQAEEVEWPEPDGKMTSIVRFYLLETLREYGWEQMETMRREQLRNRHADYFFRWLEGLYESRRANRWFEPDHNNCRAMLEWGLSGQGSIEQTASMEVMLASRWLFEGHLTEGRRWLSRVLEKYTIRNPLRTDLLKFAGLLATHQSDYEAAQMVLDDSLSLARDLNTKSKVAQTLEYLAGLASARNDTRAERQYYEEALSIWKDIDEPWCAAMTLRQMGQNAAQGSDFVRAQALYAESIMAFEALGNTVEVGMTYDWMGSCAVSQRDYLTAQTLYEHCALILRSAPPSFRQSLAHVLTHLTVPLERLGDSAKALQYGEEGLAIYRSLADKRHIPYSLGHLSQVAVSAGDYPAARSYLEEALAIQRELGNRQWVAWALQAIASISSREGNYQTARALCEEALAVYLAVRNIDSICGAYFAIAENAIESGDYQTARAYCERAIRTRREAGDPSLIIASLIETAKVALLTGEISYSRTLLDECLSLYPTMRDDLHKKRLIRLIRFQYQYDLVQKNYASSRTHIAQYAALALEANDLDMLACILEDRAALVAAEDAVELAARLLGRTDAPGERRHHERSLFDLRLYEQCVRTVRAALGAEAFEALRAEGRAMTREEAMGLALADL